MTLPTAAFASAQVALAPGLALQDGSAVDALARGSVASGLTIGGTTLQTATPLRATLCQLATVVAGATANLPPAVPGTSLTLYNDGANALTLYPLEPGSSIDNGVASASVQLSAGARCLYTCLAPGWWVSALLGATSA